MTSSIRYRAFLSYSHRDTGWGKWLHSSLENYRIDGDLVGRPTPVGPVPKVLRPIFRDRDDFSAGHSLTEQTLAALEASQFLIVLCSPSAASRRYVNEEIRRFKALGRADRVIPLIIDGEPGDPERECFPKALRFKLDSDGTLTNECEEPIAADVRPHRDGREVAKQKLVAGLLGVGFDEIVQRAKRARQRRVRMWTAIAGVFLCLGLASIASSAIAFHFFRSNESFADFTLKSATQAVDSAVVQPKKFEISRATTAKLLDAAEVGFNFLGSHGPSTPQLRYRKAWMLIHFARNYELLGQSSQQRDRAMEALELLSALAAEKPDDRTFQKDLSAAYIEIGNVQYIQGQLSNALNSYQNAFAVAERLLNSDPSNEVWQRGISLTYEKIGDILAAQDKTREALAMFIAGLAIDRSLAETHPEDARAQRDLSVTYNKIGDLKRATGDLVGALTLFRESFAIRKRLYDEKSADPERMRDFAVSHGKIGDILFRQLNFTKALSHYSGSLAIREYLVRKDSSSASWQRDLSVAHNKVGDALAAQGNWSGALTSYRAGLAIVETLTKADPANADWQRDLKLSQDNVDRLTGHGTR